MKAVARRREALQWGIITLTLTPAVALTGSTLAGHPISGGRDLCIMHLTTGAWCPLCGATRATRALMHANLPEALAYNPFTLVADAWIASVLIRAALNWRRRRNQQPTKEVITNREWLIVAATLAAFTIIRNLPGAWQWAGPLLGPPFQ